MRFGACSIRFVKYAVPLLGVALISLHAVADHAHADILASVPVSDHVPGDEHHGSSGGSCDGVRWATVAVAASAVVSVNLSVLALPSPKFEVVPLDARPSDSGPPLFLLHAALLI